MLFCQTGTSFTLDYLELFCNQFLSVTNVHTFLYRPRTSFLFMFQIVLFLIGNHQKSITRIEHNVKPQNKNFSHENIPIIILSKNYLKNNSEYSVPCENDTKTLVNVSANADLQI